MPKWVWVKSRIPSKRMSKTYHLDHGVQENLMKWKSFLVIFWKLNIFVPLVGICRQNLWIVTWRRLYKSPTKPRGSKFGRLKIQIFQQNVSWIQISKIWACLFCLCLVPLVVKFSTHNLKVMSSSPFLGPKNLISKN